MNNSIYLSTSIPYVNSVPHVGFVLELVQADALARHWRQNGDQVFLQGGTDDNSLKNVQAAEKADNLTADFVSRNADRFKSLSNGLGVVFDDFVSTSSDPRHKATVERLWIACFEAGDLYKKSYSGLYCVGCEQFYQEKELNVGCCPEHGTQPEQIAEENWFFRLSKYHERIAEAINTNTLLITPQSKRNEILSFLREPLEDLCVSRSSARAKGWGIAVPGDDTQVIYVWFDALANYLSSSWANGSDCHDIWKSAGQRKHLVGKGINRFHAVYWPAILLSAGLPLPTEILVHGYLTVNGRKIGKSNGNGIDPFHLIDAYGEEAVRWYLLRHIRTTEDADFSEEALVTSYNNDLADQLGNLVNRTLAVAAKGQRPIFCTHVEENDFTSRTASISDTFARKFDQFLISDALKELTSFISDANRYITAQAPWKLLKIENDPDAAVRFSQVLHHLFSAFRVISKCLRPALPTASDRLDAVLKRIEFGDYSAEILFERVELKIVINEAQSGK